MSRFRRKVLRKCTTLNLIALMNRRNWRHRTFSNPKANYDLIFLPRHLGDSVASLTKSVHVCIKSTLKTIVLPGFSYGWISLYESMRIKLDLIKCRPSEYNSIDRRSLLHTSVSATDCSLTPPQMNDARIILWAAKVHLLAQFHCSSADYSVAAVMLFSCRCMVYWTRWRLSALMH